VKKLVIIGLGLLGGSVAKAAKRGRLAKEIWGFGRRKARMQRAKKLRIITHATVDLRLACQDADLVVLATPFPLFESTLRQIAAYAPGSCLITDLGSVKGAHVRRWEQAAWPLKFVACHPMAGSEKTGFEHASATLFDGAPCVITPTASTDKRALKKVEAFWRGLGGRVLLRSPEAHDKIIGLYSHLTHAVSFAMASNSAKRIKKGDRPLAGPSYKDATRIASSDSELWFDIFDYNSAALKFELDAYIKELKILRALLEPGQEAGLRAWLRRVTASARKERGA
jgi:prephenate dehydrogenase